ncbi:MAG: lipid II flippase MurJ [Candidatus Paceibacterota bacterium]
MVSKLLKLLNKEFHGVNEAALLLGLFTFVSQLLGLYRDRMLAHMIGPGPTLDVYYAAFRIPDFLYVSVASLASITVLMPFMMSRLNFKNGEGKLIAQRFINNVFSAYMIFMVFICAIIFILMPYIAPHIAPGFNGDQVNMLVTTSRLMLLSPVLIGLSNLLGTITQIFKNFFVFSLSPIFYNLGILAGIFFFYPIFGVYGLALGVALGAMLHLLIQIPVVIKHEFFPSFTKIDWVEIYSVVKVSLPRTLTLSFGSIAFLSLVAIASTMKSGSISLFNFAFNLQSVPVGIIGISYSVAAFPVLVKSFSNKDMNTFISHVVGASKQIIFWTMPVIALFIVLRAQIVRVALGTNTFSWSDTRLTAAAGALFIVSLVTQSLVLLFVRGYYATGNTRKPLFVNLFSSVSIIVFALFFIYIFKVYPNTLDVFENLMRVHDVPGTIMFALPIAYTLGSILNFFLIFYLFKKDFLNNIDCGILKVFFQSLLASVSVGFVSYFMLNILDDLLPLDTGMGIFLQGFVSGVAGICVGVLVLYLFKNQELFDIYKALQKKFWRSAMVAPEQGKL